MLSHLCRFFPTSNWPLLVPVQALAIVTGGFDSWLAQRTGVSAGDVADRWVSLPAESSSALASMPSSESPSCGRRWQEEDARSQDLCVCGGSDDVPLPLARAVQRLTALYLCRFPYHLCSLSNPVPFPAWPSQFPPSHEVPGVLFLAQLRSAQVATSLHNLILSNTPLAPPLHFLPRRIIPSCSQLTHFALFPPGLASIPAGW